MFGSFCPERQAVTSMLGEISRQKHQLGQHNALHYNCNWVNKGSSFLLQFWFYVPAFFLLFSCTPSLHYLVCKEYLGVIHCKTRLQNLGFLSQESMKTYNGEIYVWKKSNICHIGKYSKIHIPQKLPCYRIAQIIHSHICLILHI